MSESLTLSPTSVAGNTELARRDLAAVWHPCTQMKDHEALPMIPIRRGDGVWLVDHDGNRYLDAVSSWWVNLFGHANPRIAAAISEQARTMEHVILAGFTHEPVITLSERLSQLAPAGLGHCFYAENGSSAVEIALKMSFHYWRNLGQHARTDFISLSNSYHGETLGALGVSDVPLYRETYSPILGLTCRIAPSPDAWLAEPGESPVAVARRRLQELEAILADHAATTCAVIVEPLVQCAGGMRMYDPEYLRGLRALCDRYEVHLIADECAVGFGRTGTMFGCEQAGISPDFLVLAKGITGGFLPMSAVLTTSRVYEAFYDDYASLRAFLHSHSYTGNAVAAAAAVATLDLFAERDVIADNRALAAHMAHEAARFVDHPHVGEVRQRGMIVAIELVRDRRSREPYPWQERRGLRVYRHAMAKGMYLRPLGNVVYWMPPYVITPEQITALAEVTWSGIEAATAD